MTERRFRLDIESISAEVVHHTVDNHEVKTLIADFGEECRMLSTTCGYRKLRYAANHYSPPIFWERDLNDFEGYLAKVHRSLQLARNNTAMLVTAVDMDNLAYRRSTFGELMVGCLVTAGAKSNAMRMGVDTAQVEGPGLSSSPLGTINVILFSNANLSDGAMAMALINITEAKAATLQDLNVRSVYTPQNIATGTGTDGIIVVSGGGANIASTSGHLKIGELIGKTVRDALIDALKKQDGLLPH